MKKYIIFGLFLLLVVAGFFALGVRNAASTVQFGYHDLSGTGAGGWANNAVNQVCVFCHTPHGANMQSRYDGDASAGTDIGGGSLNGQYLWNRRIPKGNPTFLPYTSSTLNADTSGGPGTLSLLCLSCHDGVGAINVLLKYPAGTTSIDSIFNPGVPTSGDQLGDFGLNDPNNTPLNIGGADCTGDACSGGGDLRNDHPIGFNYGAAQAADPGGLRMISDSRLVNRMLITGNRVECNTCHDPHRTNPSGGVDNNFLVIDNTNSDLCLACHNK